MYVYLCISTYVISSSWAIFIIHDCQWWGILSQLCGFIKWLHMYVEDWDATFHPCQLEHDTRWVMNWVCRRWWACTNFFVSVVVGSWGTSTSWLGSFQWADFRSSNLGLPEDLFVRFLKKMRIRGPQRPTVYLCLWKGMDDWMTGFPTFLGWNWDRGLMRPKTSWSFHVHEIGIPVRPSCTWVQHIHLLTCAPLDS